MRNCSQGGFQQQLSFLRRQFLQEGELPFSDVLSEKIVKTGLGFPIARLGVITSLSCGAILNVGFCRYSGKGQSELNLLRQMWNLFSPRDVLLADRLMCSWREMATLKEQGVDKI